MYIRVKRAKTTWFIEAKEQETIASVKKTLAALLPGKTPKDIQLQIPSKGTASGYTALEDDSKLDQMGLIDDSVIYMSIWLSSESTISPFQCSYTQTKK